MPAETDFATVMIEIAKTRVRTPHLYLALLAFAVVLLRVLSLGQDHSWDLFNYHLYGPAALLNGRWMTDVAPAQLQGFHNPLADLPLWWLVSRGAPGGLVSAWLAVPALIAVYCALRTLHWLEVSRTALVSVALLLVTGAAASGTLATSSNDWWLAAASLFAIGGVGLGGFGSGPGQRIEIDRSSLLRGAGDGRSGFVCAASGTAASTDLRPGYRRRSGNHSRLVVMVVVADLS